MFQFENCVVCCPHFCNDIHNLFQVSFFVSRKGRRVASLLINPPPLPLKPFLDAVTFIIVTSWGCIFRVYLIHGFPFQGVSYSQENEQQRRYYLDWWHPLWDGEILIPTSTTINITLAIALSLKSRLCCIFQLPRLTPYVRFCSCQLKACQLLQNKIETNSDFKQLEKVKKKAQEHF